MNGNIVSSPAIISGCVYVGSDDYCVYCLNATTGKQIWNYSTDGPVKSSPAIADGKVYVGSDDGCVYCLRADDGELLWKYQTLSGWIFSSPAVYNDKVYIGGQEGKVYCFDANPDDNGDGVVDENDHDEGIPDQSGEQYDLIWRYQTGYWVDGTPAIVMGKVFVGSYDGFFYCLNAENGGLIWSYDTSEYYNEALYGKEEQPLTYQRQISSSPCVIAQRVYFSATDGTMYCLNSSDGTKIWEATIGQGGERNAPVVSYGRVFIGSYVVDMVPPYHHHGKLYCLDADNGNHLWNYTAGTVVYFSSVADKKVFFGNGDGSIYCIDAFHGRFLWRYETTGDYILSSPAIADGKLYVGSTDGNLYCFGEDEWSFYCLFVEPAFLYNLFESFQINYL
jgi:outer membrane protein assembly factor BamB